MHVAESYVYRLPDGSGYVGRAVPVGGAKIIARRGDLVEDDVVAGLGLSDLKDRTDYGKILADAKKNGVPVTEKNDKGEIVSVVHGKGK